MMMIRFDETHEFQKDFKKLRKRYRTLLEDFKRLQLALSVYAVPTDKHAAILTNHSALQIIKVRMSCRALRKSSLRVVYSYFEQEERIEFIEIYFKGKKENENRYRIKEYLSKY